MNTELEKIINDTSDVECDNTGVGLYPKTPFEQRLVAVAYSAWLRSDLNWEKSAWSEPLYGKYRSDDEAIIRRHGEMLAAAGGGKLKIKKDHTSGPFISEFSSWGPTPELGIKPEITAHGGSILSAVPGQSYDRISGT